MRIEKRIAGLAVSLIGMALCATTAAQATTLARLSLDQLTAAADAVARVHCVSAESKWENGEIWTMTTFDVVERMKGALTPQVTVRLPGGRVGHLTAAVDGAPRFAPGEQTIVFLQRVGNTEYSVAGWVQGTFRIAQDHAGNEIVTQDSSAFAVFDPGSRAFRTEGIRRMPMEEFRRQLALATSRAEGRIR
jgi:hypothetical protein